MVIGRMRLWWRWWRLWCHVLFILCYQGRVFRSGRVPLDGGVLVLANHQSFLDPVLATLALPREAAFMARDTLFKNPAFAWMIRSLNAFPLKRGAADLAAMKEALRRLKNGHAVVLFPEGTRTRDGRIQPFHQGVAALAKRARVPIVPVLIDGAFEAWPRGRKLPGIGYRIRVEYGDPIRPERIAEMEPRYIVDLVRGRLIDMQTRMRRRLGLPLYQSDQAPGSVAR